MTEEERKAPSEPEPQKKKGREKKKPLSTEKTKEDKKPRQPEERRKTGQKDGIKATETMGTQQLEKILGVLRTESDTLQERLRAITAELERAVGERAQQLQELERQTAREWQARQNEMANLMRLWGESMTGTEMGEAMTPPESRIPTQQPGEADEEYRNRLRVWFNERLELLESLGLTFEENWRLSSPIESAIARFTIRKEPEYKQFAKELREKFEARRALQRMTRAWNIAGGVGTLLEVSPVFERSHLKTLFTLRDESGRPIVAEKFRELERKARELKQLKKSKDGETEEEKNERQRQKDEKEKKIKSFIGEDSSWDEKIAARLWSVTGRAAYFDINLNGSGDFFLGRQLNLHDRLKGNLLFQGREALWDGERPFDFGIRDFWSSDNFLATDKLGMEFAQEFGVEARPVGDTGEEAKKIDQVVSLANARLEDTEFWQKVEDAGVAVDTLKNHMLDAMDMEDTRKALTDPGGFYHLAEEGTFLKLMTVFKHISTSEGGGVTLKDEKGKLILDKKGNPIRVSQREAVWQDLLERTVRWAMGPQGKEVLEEFQIAPELEARNYILAADKSEMIKDAQRDELYRRLLPLGPFQGKRAAELKATLSLFLMPYRWGTFRTALITKTISNFFSSLFNYIFGEYLRGK
jgi:hypothetical protein